MKILNERGLAQALRVFETHGWRAGRLVASGDRKLVRLFFYLQVWRTSICDKTLKLLAETAENLRQIILNYETVDENEITHFPLSVTYLETVGDEHEYTTNIVSYTSDKNPNLIFINDFVIQFYENLEAVKYFDFYELNTELLNKEFLNYKEEQFLINIFSNARRKKLLNHFIITKREKQTIQHYADRFAELWLKFFGVYPPSQTTQEYLTKLIGESDFHISRLFKS